MMLICMSNGQAIGMSSAQPERHGGAQAMAASSMVPAESACLGPCTLAQDGAQLSKIECGTGSVCIASVALPAAPLDIPASGMSVAPRSFVPDASFGFFTDGPDRPPRPFFA